MPTPDFILELRDKIGTAPLWLTGVTAVVIKDEPGAGRQVLCVRRADTGEWTPVTGIVDPGEHPADAAVREVAEEAAVTASPTRLAKVGVTSTITYANGDRTRYIDLTWRLTWSAGVPHPADGENTEAAWFAPDDLPAMSAEMAARVAAALPERGEAVF
ncbi:8-oxo-dGTP pyrophosphatase MutT (NUDIX family) [Naumannella cuiyingiana]|uniref:8-oxo-dGTP pyrophosphatase MutT (NUDIX family) n=1 Tax=Naumannella cuiyingiana TaxID=1347891 RepID=A0A7Z0IME2_9ACTN|nr:8-oxo-dGTP pyrophosphatase MutT (NUDIX family) [Naumannella cuiyingiana]